MGIQEHEHPWLRQLTGEGVVRVLSVEVEGELAGGVFEGELDAWLRREWLAGLRVALEALLCCVD